MLATKLSEMTARKTEPQQKRRGKNFNCPIRMATLSKIYGQGYGNLKSAFILTEFMIEIKIFLCKGTDLHYRKRV